MVNSQENEPQLKHVITCLSFQLAIWLLDVTCQDVSRTEIDSTYGYGSIPINTIFRGLFTSILTQLFWCEQKGYYRFWHTAILTSSKIATGGKAPHSSTPPMGTSRRSSMSSAFRVPSSSSRFSWSHHEPGSTLPGSVKTACPMKGPMVMVSNGHYKYYNIWYIYIWNWHCDFKVSPSLTS